MQVSPELVVGQKRYHSTEAYSDHSSSAREDQTDSENDNDNDSIRADESEEVTRRGKTYDKTKTCLEHS